MSNTDGGIRDPSPSKKSTQPNPRLSVNYNFRRRQVFIDAFLSSSKLNERINENQQQSKAPKRRPSLSYKSSSDSESDDEDTIVPKRQSVSPKKPKVDDTSPAERSLTSPPKLPVAIETFSVVQSPSVKPVLRTSYHIRSRPVEISKILTTNSSNKTQREPTSTKANGILHNKPKSKICEGCEERIANLTCIQQLCSGCCGKKSNGCRVTSHRISKRSNGTRDDSSSGSENESSEESSSGDSDSSNSVRRRLSLSNSDDSSNNSSGKPEKCKVCKRTVTDRMTVGDICESCWISPPSRSDSETPSDEERDSKKPRRSSSVNGSPLINVCKVCKLRPRNQECVEKLCKFCCLPRDNRCYITSHKKTKISKLIKEVKKENRAKDKMKQELRRAKKSKEKRSVKDDDSSKDEQISDSQEEVKPKTKLCLRCKSAPVVKSKDSNNNNSLSGEVLCEQCKSMGERNVHYFMRPKPAALMPSKCPQCLLRPMIFNCQELMCWHCCSLRDNGCPIPSHRGPGEKTSPGNGRRRSLSSSGSDSSGSDSDSDSSSGSESEDSDVEDICSKCQRRKLNTLCTNKLCKKCCIFKGNIPCRVHNKECAPYYVMKDGGEDFYVICNGCNKRKANVRCTDLLCSKCCVVRNNDCPEKGHRRKLKRRSPNGSPEVPICPRCHRRPGNSKCMQELCKRCCIKRGNECPAKEHQESGSSDTEKKHKCKQCNDKNASPLCPDTLCKRCCVSQKQSNCTYHQKPTLNTPPVETLNPFEQAVVNVINEMYDPIDDGFSIPKDEELFSNGGAPIRELDGFGSSTYGEIAVRSVPKLVNLMNLTKDDIFYDLGCGIGKSVIQVALLTGCKKSIGIELSHTRFDISIEALEIFQHESSGMILMQNPKAVSSLRIDPNESPSEDLKDETNSSTKKDMMTWIKEITPPERLTTNKIPPSIQPVNTQITFLHQDILKTDLSDGTAIFWNNVCFPPILCSMIIQQFQKQLKPGTRILCMKKICSRHSSMCKTRPCSSFELVKQSYVTCSWTYKCQCFLYIKK